MSAGIPSFAELLADCTDSAVHLELRDSYADNERFAAWRSGERIGWDNRESWWRPFHQTVADAVARGVVVRRARVVSEPVSEYIRWEYYATAANIAADEQVRWLPRRQATGLALPGNDHWLLDGRLLRIHHFDGDGNVIEDELTSDTETVKLCATAFESVWERAVPHDQYEIH
ncbi:DUF6879 family protein [Streptomyces sp. 21So2-11]|uniref:DUF6879 family protein n=1 Tax=Streptomyces sp. 21So2-11 TaxID=3144408 RepID=UPI00321B58CB